MTETDESTPAFTEPTRSTLITRRDALFAGIGLGLGLVVALAVATIPSLVSGASGMASGFGPTPIEAAVHACDAAGEFIRIGDDGWSLTMRSVGEEDDGASFVDIFCVLEELDVPDSIVSRMEATRALDGRLDGSWADFAVSWGYHPDSGIDIVIERVDG